ncbi:hypothetical protein LTR95_015901 [Oleoguttula sp. CCFEE 5521]
MNPNSPTGPNSKGKGKASGSPATPAGTKGKGQAVEGPPSLQKSKRKPTSPPEGAGTQPQKRKKSQDSNGSNTAGPSSARPVTPEGGTGTTTATDSTPPISAPAPATGTNTTTGAAPPTTIPAPAPSAASPSLRPNRSRVRRPFGYSNTFRVRVGKLPNHQVFTLHKDLFCQRSRYFRGQRAWKNPEPKGQPNRVSFNHVTELPEVDPEVFGHCVAATVSGDFDFAEPVRGAWNIDFKAYFDLYILADYLSDLRMANAVIDELVTASEISRDHAHWKTDIDYLYARTLPTSQLRALCEDWLLQELTADAPDQRTDINHELLIEVFQKYRMIKGRAMDAYLDDGRETRVRRVFNKNVSEAERCEYHLHDQEMRACLGTRELVRRMEEAREIDEDINDGIEPQDYAMPGF